jgi:hypothetical protein
VLDCRYLVVEEWGPMMPSMLDELQRIAEQLREMPPLMIGSPYIQAGMMLGPMQLDGKRVVMCSLSDMREAAAQIGVKVIPYQGSEVRFVLEDPFTALRNAVRGGNDASH